MTLPTPSELNATLANLEQWKGKIEQHLTSGEVPIIMNSLKILEILLTPDDGEKGDRLWSELPRSIVQALSMGCRGGEDLEKWLYLREPPAWLVEECKNAPKHFAAGTWVVLILKALLDRAQGMADVNQS